MPDDKPAGRVYGRSPDYNLGALDRESGLKGKVGAAWKNEDGTINIKLNPFVALRSGLSLTLFPADRDFRRGQTPPGDAFDDPFASPG